MSWLDSLLVAALDNALGATVLAGVVFLITRWWRNPLVVHALWLLVLVKLVAPPVVPLHWGMSSASLLRLPSAPAPAAVEPERVLRDEPAVAASDAPLENHLANPQAVASPPPAFESTAPVIESPAKTLAATPELPAEPIAATEAPILAPVNQSIEDPPSASPAALTPPTDTPRARPWRWQTVAALAWLSGSAAYLALAGLRIARFQRSLAALPAADDRVQHLAAEVGQRLGYRGPLTVRVSPGRTPPLLWAVGRPTILLPRALLDMLGENELAGMLAHELAHLVRRDPWVRWFELLVVGLYWWHPVAWGARRALRDAEEIACDALVLDRLGTGPEAYVRGLLHALDLATGASGPSLASSLGRKGSLHRRVEAMLARRYAPRLSWAAGLMIGLVALAFVPLSMRANPVQEATKTDLVAAAPTNAEDEEAKEGAGSKAASAPSETAAQDDLDPRLGPAADLDPRVRERYRQYLRPPYWRDEDMVTVKGKTIDEQGQPVANADVEVRVMAYGTVAHTRSNAAGEFGLRVPPGYLEQIAGPGRFLAKSEAGDLMGYAKLAAGPETAEVTLRPAQPIEARVVDAEGAPVSGAAFTVVFGDGLTTSVVTNDQGVARVELPKAAPLEQAFARKDGLGMALVALDEEGPKPAEKVSAPLELKFDGARTITVRTIDGRDGSPVPGLPVTLRNLRTHADGGRVVQWELPELQIFTDEQGEAKFTWASPELPYHIDVRGWDRILYAQFEPGKDDATETLELWPRVKVTGQVRFADGRPAANMPVLVGGGQHQFEVRSGEDGKFSAEVEANRYYLFVAGDKQWASLAKAIVIGHESPPPLAFVLGPAIRIFGTDPDFRRVRLEQSTDFAYENLPRDQHLPLRLGELVGRPTIERTAETNAEGAFEFFVGPGHYALLGPRGAQVESNPRFTLTDQKEYRASLHDSPAEVRLKGTVVRRDDPQTTVADAFIDLDTRVPGPPLRSEAKGEFSVSVPDDDQVIEVRAAGGLIGRVERRQGTNEIVIPVGPGSTFRGRVVDQSGKAIQGRVTYRIARDREGARSFTFLSNGQAKLDAEGRFALDRIAPGWNYSLSVSPEAADGARMRPTGRRSTGQIWLGIARADTSDPVDLGDLVAQSEGAPAGAAGKTLAKAVNAGDTTKAPVEPAAKSLDPRLGPSSWVDPQVREYLRNYMLRPEWPQPTAAIRGRVVDAQGNPAANVDVMAQTNLFGTVAVAKTDERGEFDMPSADSNPALIATSNDGAFLGYFRAPQAEAERPAQPYVVMLEAPREIDAHVVDGQGQPVSAAIVTAIFGDGLSAVATTDEQGRAKLRVPQAAPLEAVFARKDNVGLDVVTFDQVGKPERDVGASPFELTLKGARTITVRAVDGRDGKPVPGSLVSYRLSRNGKNHMLHTLAELYQFVGDDGAASFSFAPLDETSSVTVHAFDSKLIPENMGFVQFDPQRSGNEYTLEFWPRVKLVGQVRFADGRPAPGLPVLVAGGQRGGSARPSPATTDAAGKFALEVDANDYYLLAAGDKQWAAPMKTLVVGHESPPPVELTLGSAIRVFGRDPNLRRIVLTEHPATAYEALPRSELLPLRLTPFPMRSQLQRTGETDVDGKYEFFVGPGTYSVEGPPGVARATTPSFTLTEEKEYDVDRGAPGAANARVKVRIVRADDPQVGLERARYYIHRFDRQPPEGKRADAAGIADVDSLGSRFVVEAQDDDQKLVGMVESKPGETELVVPLSPPAVVRGRLIDRAGRRFGGRVDYRVVQGNNVIQAGGNPSVSHGQAKIGDDGRFVLDKLAPGWTYSLSASLNYPDEPRQGRYKHAWLGTAETASAPVDLGDLTIEPAY
ncbi:MAG: M56 family metallopeptidase [Pirellulales bacterium]